MTHSWSISLSLVLLAADTSNFRSLNTQAFSVNSVIIAKKSVHSTGSTFNKGPCRALNDSHEGMCTDKERPLLRKFGRGIRKRILHSEEGSNRSGKFGAYTSEETIPCLDMQVASAATCKVKKEHGNRRDGKISTRKAIRRAFTESSRIPLNLEIGQGNLQSPHGRSSGSGSAIIRLTGEDAKSIRGLVQYADRFFEKVDDDAHNSQVQNTGVFRIDNHVYAGFDDNVNMEGKMQFLDTRLMTQVSNSDGSGRKGGDSTPINGDIGDPMLLPLEVGDLVGSTSLKNAHRGMSTLMDIGSQITSAVLDMDEISAEKLIDDGTCNQRQATNSYGGSGSLSADSVSNSYHRLIRYLKPQQPNSAAFAAHVDSSFLTLIPMPELPGLEVWCPDRDQNHSTQRRGEWVRPEIPSSSDSGIGDIIDSRISGSNKYIDDECPISGADDCAYVIAMAGEFLQLVSNGEVPVCIHRVIPPSPPVDTGLKTRKYRPRVSAPLFLRPRRGEDAKLDVEKDLSPVEEPEYSVPQALYHTRSASGLYYEEGLLNECDSMHLWSAHDIMMQK